MARPGDDEKRTTPGDDEMAKPGDDEMADWPPYRPALMALASPRSRAAWNSCETCDN